jgi:hypothetical protein
MRVKRRAALIPPPTNAKQVISDRDAVTQFALKSRHVSKGLPFIPTTFHCISG